REIATPSQWRQLELTASPGSKLALVVDRAGREAETELTLVARVRPAGRDATDRYREEQRVGVVFRTATEVEARSAGLGPGAGAVIVGMSQKSPWRRAGLQFGDLIVAAGGAELTHPQQLLNQIREAGGDRLSLVYVRGGQRAEVDAALTTRSSTLRELSVPPLFSYEADRGQSEWSALLGLVHYRSTAAAWRFRLLWVIAIRSGDADELQEPGA
ncbi:MAG: PDZ domain-containing protein, partial [Planctomycetota bacterium]|nr:PDZ domain-containing protein [Planctomycetota bacterium]